MTKWMIRGSRLCLAFVTACSSSSSPATPVDGGTHDAPGAHDAPGKGDTGTTDAAKDAAEKPEAAPPVEAGHNDAGGPRHLLVTYDGVTSTSSTMLAINLATGKQDGTLTTADTQAITDTSNAGVPFLLHQSTDVVDSLDPAGWTVASSWSVANPDAGGNTSDPVAIVLASPTLAFVIRYASNRIVLINPSDSTQGTSTYDLSSLVQPNDEDGLVEATSGSYVASSKTLYVVLGNIDTYATVTYAGNTDTICGQTTSTVIAFDTMTNKVKPIGSGPGGGIALKGYDPTSSVYDAANNRLLVFEAGCNPSPTADGGAPGALTLRGVEEVDLATNTSKILVDTSDKGFPGNLVYVSPHQAVLGFTYPIYEAYNWDPTTMSLGSQLPNAPNLFDYDGNGNIVGASINYGDGGSATTDIISMSLSTGKATTLIANALTIGTAYLGSAGVWPRP